MLSDTREITYAQAINEAIHEEMRRDDTVVVFGEDVAAAGGVYKLTKGLLGDFGPVRVRDTPISEASIVGLAVGAALTGLRPIVEIMFGDFLGLAMDQIANQAAKAHYMSGGSLRTPLVIRTTMGAGRRVAAQHSQSLCAWVAHIPGVKVVLPSTPYDAKGLLKTAIRDNNPVVFFEDKLMYPKKGPVPIASDDYAIPFGHADVKRKGTDLTIIATSRMVHVALEASELLAREAIEAEVIDLRTVTPLDEDTITSSVKNTGRCIVLDQGYQRFGASAEIAAVIGERTFHQLKAPVCRISGMDVPVPFSPVLEDQTIPTSATVVKAARTMFGR